MDGDIVSMIVIRPIVYFIKIENKFNLFLFIIMSLEEFLNPAVNGWHIQNAYELILHACHIMTLLEKGKYTELSACLEKKESYFTLLKELDELVDKYDLRKWVSKYQLSHEPLDWDESSIRDYAFITRTKEEFLQDTRNQTICYYYHTLGYADRLVARDDEWTGYNYDSD